MDFRCGTLAIPIEGNWKASEFSNIISNVDNVYKILSTFDYLKRNEDTNSNIKKQYKNINYFNFESTYFEKYVNDFKVVNTGDVLDLKIARCKYNSPGFIEFFGNYNPLKIIKDFLLEYKKLKLREKNEEFSHVMELNEFRLRAVKELYSLQSSFPDESKEISQKMLDQSFALLKAMVDDSRIDTYNVHIGGYSGREQE